MRYLLVILLFMNLLPLRASHIVGGDIWYDYLGNNNYQFFISLYRDCLSTGAQFDNPLYMAVYNSSGGLIQNVQIPFPGSTTLPVTFNNPCVNPPTNICTEVATYTTVVNLPPIPGGYDITYQRCCRGPNINNLVQPDNTGLTLTTHVPGSDTGANINSSARFTNYPPLLLCNNEDLIFDHSATDPDGDQLVYSLTTPYAGASSVNPQPIPAPPPNYPLVNWDAGFNAANPLGPGATISINSSTGLLTASPNLLGRFVVGIKVDEYRNGVLINSSIRDFIFRVFNCNVDLQAILPLQTDLSSFQSYCQGLTVDFENNSINNTSLPLNYLWDFGDPTTTSDFSTAFEPSYTYPGPGQYTVMLVVNPGMPCSDTAYMDVIVNEDLIIEYTSQDSLCIFDNSFDFVATSATPGVTYEWDFGPNATPSSGTGSTVNGVTFNTTGFIEVILTGSIPSCESEYIDSIYIFPEPVAEIILPANIECLGYTIDFGNNSQNSTIFEWEFGDGNTSTTEEPTNTYPGPGTYTITLVAGSTPVCKDTTTATIQINEPIIIDFTSQDSLCESNAVFDFDGTVSGPPNTVYTYNFGPNGNPQTSNNIDEFGVTFDTTGYIPITLSATDGICFESVTHGIYIYKEPTIDFSLAPGLQCVPFEAHFIDESWAETTIFYSWEFGDGGTSTDPNPVHLYTDTGAFAVTLTIETIDGCPATLSLTQSDLVHVRPIPEAGFSLSTDYTDICHSSIVFTDQSQGGYEYFYWFDDSTAFSELQNPPHLYLYDGHHYPMQIVTNEWGCKDTAYSKLYIEPYTFYAPNAFTPDKDEFNNDWKPIAYLGTEEYNLKIYDRWGELIWESFDLNVGWDGIIGNGRMAEDGIYIYKIELESCEPIGPEKIYTGHIVLIR